MTPLGKCFQIHRKFGRCGKSGRPGLIFLAAAYHRPANVTKEKQQTHKYTMSFTHERASKDDFWAAVKGAQDTHGKRSAWGKLDAHGKPWGKDHTRPWSIELDTWGPFATSRLLTGLTVNKQPPALSDGHGPRFFFFARADRQVQMKALQNKQMKARDCAF